MQGLLVLQGLLLVLQGLLLLLLLLQGLLLLLLLLHGLLVLVGEVAGGGGGGAQGRHQLPDPCHDQVGVVAVDVPQLLHGGAGVGGQLGGGLLLLVGRHVGVHGLQQPGVGGQAGGQAGWQGGQAGGQGHGQAHGGDGVQGGHGGGGGGGGHGGRPGGDVGVPGGAGKADLGGGGVGHGAGRGHGWAARAVGAVVGVVAQLIAGATEGVGAAILLPVTLVTHRSLPHGGGEEGEGGVVGGGRGEGGEQGGAGGRAGARVQGSRRRGGSRAWEGEGGAPAPQLAVVGEEEQLGRLEGGGHRPVAEAGRGVDVEVAGVAGGAGQVRHGLELQDTTELLAGRG